MNTFTSYCVRHIRLLIGVAIGAVAATIATFVLFGAPKGDEVTIKGLTTEHVENPIGIDVSQPRFGWTIASNGRPEMQEAYRIEVWGDGNKRELVWDSGIVNSQLSNEIPYDGEPLKAVTEYTWVVTVTDQNGKRFQSDAATFETGLMDSAFQDSQWIAAPENEYPDLNENTCFLISEEVQVEKFGSGIIWGYSDEDLAFYNEQIFVNEETGEIKLALRSFYKYMEQDRQEYDISDVLSLKDITDKAVKWDVLVLGNQVITYLEDKCVWKAELGHERGLQGAVGFYGERSSVSYVDSYRVMELAESAFDVEETNIENLEAVLAEQEVNIRYEEDFEDTTETIFGDQYVNVTDDGRLKMDTTILLTPNQYNDGAAPVFHKQYDLTDGKVVQKARFYATAAGCYDAKINGNPVTDTFMNPGNEVFNIRTLYQTFDVTELVKENNHTVTIDAAIGHGWYNRGVGYEGIGSPWGVRNAFLAKLVLTYEDGTCDVINTDNTWDVYLDGPIRVNDLWQGEVYDAQKETLTKDSWGKVDTIVPEWFDGTIESQPMRSISTVQEIQPVNSWTSHDGSIVYDFGQEISGVCRVSVVGEAGAVVTMRHSEWINEDSMNDADGPEGTLYTFNLQGAQQTDRYILKGNEPETYQPTMTIHGFRYMSLETEGAVTVNLVTAVQLSSVGESAGQFSSGNDKLNRLYRNIVYTGQNNLISNPMDCNQRSERLGWTGDAQIFSGTALYMYCGGQNFYENYVREMREVQNPETGAVSDLAPRSFDTDLTGVGGVANYGWGDAMIIIPWNLYLQYGDVHVLEESYDSMKAWTEYQKQQSENWILPDNGYGDHLALDSLAKPVVNTAWAAHSCQLMAKIARVTGHIEDIDAFNDAFNQYRLAWIQNYMSGDGTIAPDSQGVYVLGLAFGLVPDDLREAAASKLVNNIVENGNHLLSGYAAAGYVLQTLADAGYVDLAYEVLIDESWPSYQYEINNGATTIWETGRTHINHEDGTYTLGGASLNHMAKGAIGKWFYEGMAGIKSDEAAPGFKHVIFEPKIPNNPDLRNKIDHIEAFYESGYGVIAADWKLEESGSVTYTVTLPANTSGTVILPGVDEQEITAGTFTYEIP